MMGHSARRGAMPLVAGCLFATSAAAQSARPNLQLASAAPPATTDHPEGDVDAGNDTPGYTPAETMPVGGPLHVNGYVDIGYAKAQGDGTSFPSADYAVPADYGVDTFAPAVNSRGDVASTDAGGTFVNGFLPRSVGIRGQPSFLINTVDLDLRYQAPSSPVMIFTRVQFLPRFSGAGDSTRLYVEQAFGRITPFDTHELTLSVGKFDSVFGVEYQDNQANVRTGITPSLSARYTTGTSVGAKVFYRLQIPALASALSLNVAATNSGNMVESLQSPDVSVAGMPVFSGRLGYELNPPVIQLKLGVSGLRGPRNDQRDRDEDQYMWGYDARIFVAGFALAGEYVHVNEDEGVGPKVTALGTFPLASGFHARVFWLQASYTPPLEVGPLRRVSPYARYECRHAWFDGFVPIMVDRITAGLRLDFWDNLIVKGEVLVNRELQGAPTVPNNVYTSSVVYQW